MKTASLVPLLLLLAACHRGEGDKAAPASEPQGSASTQASAPASAADDGKVECAPQGSAEFERNCTIDRVDGPDGRVLTLRAPDGSFRRLVVTRDGRGVVAADGAEPAKVTILGPDRIEVTVGRDRYRLPATVKK